MHIVTETISTPKELTQLFDEDESVVSSIFPSQFIASVETADQYLKY